MTQLSQGNPALKPECGGVVRPSFLPGFSLMFAQDRVPAIGYTDLTFKYTVDRHLEAYAQGDDIEGRYITAGLRLKL